MRGQYVVAGERLLALAGSEGGDLCGLRPPAPALLHLRSDLFAAQAGSIQILLRVSLDLRRSAASGLDLIAETPQFVGKGGLIDGGCVLLALEERALLQGACRAVRSLGDVEDDDVRMELWRGVPVHGSGGVMLELGRDELAGGLGEVVAPDPRLGVSLQLVERGRNSRGVGLPHALIAAYQGSERNGFRRGKGRVPPSAMFHAFGRHAVRVGVLGGGAVLHQLRLGLRVLPFGQQRKLPRSDRAG